MVGKKLSTLSLTMALILGFLGCEKEENLEKKVANVTPIVKTIKGIDYQINGNKLIQKTEDEDNIARFGVIADPHGFYENVKVFSEYFEQQGVDGIILLGDYAQHFREKPNPKLSDYDEIIWCLENAAKTGLPIYIIPGNHEMKKDYKKAMKQLSKTYKNIFDLSEIRIVDGDDFDFVSNPFGTDFTYPNESFRGTPEQIRKIIEYVKQLQKDDDPEILISHQPPRCKSNYGIDVVYGGNHASDEGQTSNNDGYDNDGYATLDKIMREKGIKFSLSGHIHEAGGRGVTSEGALVLQDSFSSDLRFNPGSAAPCEYLDGKFCKGMAGILTVEGDKAEYRIITLK